MTEDTGGVTTGSGVSLCDGISVVVIDMLEASVLVVPDCSTGRYLSGAPKSWHSDIVRIDIERKVLQHIAIMGGMICVGAGLLDDAYEVFGEMLDVAFTECGHMTETVH